MKDLKTKNLSFRIPSKRFMYVRLQVSVQVQRVLVNIGYLIWDRHQTNGVQVIIIAIIAIATLGESVGGGTQSTSSGSAGSNTGTYSQKKYDHVKENTMSTMNNQKDNRPAYETDTNPNHHYIADYRSFGGIKLFKVHDSMGDYIMLDNSITSRKICNLKEAESGKHKFYRRENGKEINIAEIPWK